jgi:hypothetical protein
MIQLDPVEEKQLPERIQDVRKFIYYLRESDELLREIHSKLMGSKK